MKKTFTIGEFYDECVLFPYSREHFELLHEAYENDLRCIYRRNMEFLESAQYEEISKVHQFPKGYFQEYREDVFNEGSEKSTDGIFARIYKSISSVFTGFIAAAKRLLNRLMNIKTIDLEKLGNEWKTMTWKAETIKAIAEEYKVKFADWAKYKIKPGDGSKVPELKIEGNVDEVTRRGFTNYITSVCIPNTVVDMRENVHMVKMPSFLQGAKSTADGAIKKITDGPAGVGVAVAGTALVALGIGGITKIVKIVKNIKTYQDFEKAIEEIKRDISSNDDQLDMAVTVNDWEFANKLMEEIHNGEAELKELQPKFEEFKNSSEGNFAGKMVELITWIRGLCGSAISFITNAILVKQTVSTGKKALKAVGGVFADIINGVHKSRKQNSEESKQTSQSTTDQATNDKSATT